MSEVHRGFHNVFFILLILIICQNDIGGSVIHKMAAIGRVNVMETDSSKTPKNCSEVVLINDSSSFIHS